MSVTILPQQSDTISDERAAIAPYNFVPLPERVVCAEQQEPVDQSVYHADRFTGRIACTLTTELPLYVRCGLTLEQFRQSEAQKREDERDDRGTADAATGFRERAKNTPEFFYTWSKEAPVIPGSSLRGMLRALVEIASYGKVERVTSEQHYFFRAVAAKVDDPLANPYRGLLKNVRAGYLEKDGDGWSIRPAKTIGSDPYVKVRERDIPPLLGLIRLNDREYRPQYIPVSFTTKTTPNGRTVVDQIDKPGVYTYQGTLVTSGNMLETGKDSKWARSPRKNHCVVLEPGGDPLLPIDRKAIDDYRSGLTDFQQVPPFDERRGMLEDKRPVFYCQPMRNQPVVFFGQSPNFRIPYRWRGSERAASPLDFVPTDLRNAGDVDLAEAIFGYVRRDKQRQGEQARAGRVFVGEATLLPGQDGVLYDEVMTPHILGSPKPTTFQHYLVQPATEKRQLKHYASEPGSETVIRGHKLYWHKGEVGLDAIREDDRQKIARAPKQYTQFRPVKPQTMFEFVIHFDNLSAIELGALLWVLQLADDADHRLKLGMGKPLGMGAVKVTSSLWLSDRAARYARLLDEATWETGEYAVPLEDHGQYIGAFETYVLDELFKEVPDQRRRVATLKELTRIGCLLALLKWPGPASNVTRYMEIERSVDDGYIPAAKPVRPNDPTLNEYRDRPVLPSPLQVIGEAAALGATPAPRQAIPVASPPPAISAPQRVIPAIGDVITGNRSGPTREPIRGVKVDINRKWYQVPANTTVVGVIRTEDAGGQVSGGFKGEVVGRQDDKQVVYLFLRPVKGEK